MHLGLSVTVFVLLFSTPIPPIGADFKPTSHYTRRAIQGWTVLLNKDLLSEDRALAEEVVALLEVKLYDIKRVLPPQAIEQLQRISIWVEQSNPDYPCACYHPSREWLSRNGYNPEKENSVEIANPRNFLTWTIDQPSMVLHELAHGFHDMVLGHDHQALRSAYQAAVEAGTYESVLRFNGKTERHYALNSDQEYFAEATEAYYGTNDFYPFVRAELGVHDRRMHDLVPKLWAAGE